MCSDSVSYLYIVHTSVNIEFDERCSDIAATMIPLRFQMKVDFCCCCGCIFDYDALPHSNAIHTITVVYHKSQPHAHTHMHISNGLFINDKNDEQKNRHLNKF